MSTHSNYPFHLVNYSPWPLTGAIQVLFFTILLGIYFTIIMKCVTFSGKKWQMGKVSDQYTKGKITLQNSTYTPLWTDS